MSLEEDIVAWCTSRPLRWQRHILGRIAAQEHLSDADYDQVIDDILSGKNLEVFPVGLEHFVSDDADTPPVSLLAVSSTDHVNALATPEPLAFGPTGLTIIYGDNGSGKSGYARLLKNVARTRHREDRVLSDAFRDNAIDKPTASLSVQVGMTVIPVDWPNSKPGELQQMLFYDEACGAVYGSEESPFPYRPSALFVMDGLLSACSTIRKRIDVRLDDNQKLAQRVPEVEAGTEQTAAGKFLLGLSGKSSVESLDQLIAGLSESTDTAASLKLSESRLLSADTSSARQQLTRLAGKLTATKTHIEALQLALSAAALTALEEGRAQLTVLEEAATLLASTFVSEPLPTGVGGKAWLALWESARRFSSEQAYPSTPFPVTSAGARCVLCQEPLDDEGSNRLAGERLIRFEQFVQDDTQTRLVAARTKWKATVAKVTSLEVLPAVVEAQLKDLESDHTETVQSVRALLDSYESLKAHFVALANGVPEASAPNGVEPQAILTQIAEKANSANAEAAGLADPAEAIKLRSAATARRKEFELLEIVRDARQTIVDEISRLKLRDALTAVKNEALTTTISNKISALSERSITVRVQDTFTRETDRLNLERVTITKTRTEKGTLLHQPQLVGTRQDVTLPRIFSEGERTALGLAAFFTEALLEASTSALILDDPVTSLDHIRRGQVAARLAKFAESRQVIVFTHDISLVADLKLEAADLGVAVTERSVAKGRTFDARPGMCSDKLPWKVKDVPARLNDLDARLSRMKKKLDVWDEDTYDKEVGAWAGSLSETWESVFSQVVVGPILAEGGLEVRPKMVKVLARFTNEDEQEFQTSYSRVSQWTKRHDKNAKVNYRAPDIPPLRQELALVKSWYERVKGYQKR